MRFSSLAVLAAIGSAAAQGVTDKIAPKEPSPAGCQQSFNGLFQVTVEDVTLQTGKRSLKKRDSCAADGTLVVGLAGGVLTDAKSRTGYIASNRQFQFDGPPQAGAIYTAGFSVCGNSSLALGGSTTFYQCASGDFFNLYDSNTAHQCSPVQIVALPCGGPDPPYASQIPDGQVVGTQVVTTTIVVPLSDGQPQVITTTVPVPLCQIGDGQVQQKTTPCASITQKPSTAPAPVSQYSDGQIQITPGTPAPAPPATATPAPPPAPASSSAAAPPPAPPASSPSSAAASPPPAAATTPKPVSSPASTLTSASSSARASSSSAASSPSPSIAPPNAAAQLEMSSVAALAVGLVGAMLIL